MFRPGRLPTHIRAQIEPVLAVVGHARRRLWMQRTFARLTSGLAVPLAALGAWTLTARLGAVQADVDIWVWSGFALLSLIVLFVAHLGRPTWLQAARTTDRAAHGQDRLTTALWLAHEHRSDGWALAQAAAATRFSAQVDVPALFPWRRPAAWPWTVAALVVFAAGMWTPLPWDARVQWLGPQPAQAVDVRLPALPVGFATAADLLGKDMVSLLGADIQLLAEVEAQVEDADTKEWLRQVREVAEGVADGRLDKRQALDKLAELEANRPDKPVDPAATDPTQTPDNPGGETADTAQQRKDQAVRNAVLEAAAAAGKELPNEEDRKAVEKAVKEQDLDALAKLAEKLADRDWSDAEVEKWMKTLEKFADKLKDRKIPDRRKKLADQVDRLQKKRAAQGGLGKADQERLKQARHDLEQLKRDNGDALAAEHEVERLERGARAAADELRRQQEQSRLGQKGGDKAERDKKAAEEAKARAAATKAQARVAAEELRRESQDQQGRQAQRIGEARLKEIREALERAGESDDSRREFERKARAEQPGEGDKSDKGEGGNKSRLTKREPGKPAAPQPPGGEKGEDGKDKGMQLGKGKLEGKSRIELLREGYEQKGQADDGEPEESSKVADSPGTGRGDDREDPTQDRVAGGKREKLTGQKNDGPDVKQTFVDAARKGFSQQGWSDVYAEYSEVAEQMLDAEELPPGRRATVRRYFELIRPRTTTPAP